ncbi:MAG: VOC family protein [Actinocatenispora sp.]
MTSTATETVTGIDRIDHPMVLTTDLDSLALAYQAIGFLLTPQSSRHRGTDPATGATRPLGTANRHVVFAENSIELLGLMDPDAPDPWGTRRLLAAYEGVRAIVFGCGDAEAVDTRLTTAQLATTGVLGFRREVDTPTGSATMCARTAHLLPMHTPEGGLGIAEHLTPELVRQARYTGHPNGAVALSAVTLVVADADLDGYLERYRTLLDATPHDDGPRHVFPLRRGRVELVPASAMDEVLPGESAPVLPFMAALTVTVADLGTARSVVRGNGVAVHEVRDGFFVRAADARGAAVVFTERP